MAISQNDIREWIEKAKSSNCTHILVVCDTFDYEDYMVEIHPKGQKPLIEKNYIFFHDDVDLAIQKYSTDMQKVMEVYNLSMDIESQLAEDRAWHV